MKNRPVLAHRTAFRYIPEDAYNIEISTYIVSFSGPSGKKAKYTKSKDGYFKIRVWDGTYDDVGRKKYVTIRSKKSRSPLSLTS